MKTELEKYTHPSPRPKPFWLVATLRAGLGAGPNASKRSAVVKQARTN